jgi:hypothetical protein
MEYIRPKTHLIMQYYKPINKTRRYEINYTLEQNLNNPAIDFVHNIMEPDTQLPDNLKDHPKLITTTIDTNATKATTDINEIWTIKFLTYCELDEILNTLVSTENGKQVINKRNLYKLNNLLKKRLTFEYAVNYINRTIPSNEVVIISNSDIIIENSKAWYDINNNLFEIDNNIALCLSRHEMDEYNQIWGGMVSLFKTCQDTWCMKTPLKNIKDISFTVGGCPQCDNAIMERLQKAGYRIFNWATKYRIFHYDNVKRHNGNRMFLSRYCDLSIPGSKRHSLDKGLTCCPFLNYNILLFDKSYITTDNNPNSSDCIYYWNKNYKVDRFSQENHINSHTFPKNIICDIIKYKMGKTYDIFHANVFNYNHQTKKQKTSWGLLDFNTMEEQIYYYINMLLLNKRDVNLENGFSDDCLKVFLDYCRRCIYNV